MSRNLGKATDSLKACGEHPAFNYEIDARPASCEEGFYGYVYASGADRREDLPCHVTLRPYTTAEAAMAVAADWVLSTIEASEAAVAS